MKKNILLLTMILSFLYPVSPASASDNFPDSYLLPEHVSEEMNNFIDSTDLNFQIDNLNISIRDDINLSEYTDAQLAELLEKDMALMKEQLLSVENILTTTSNKDQENMITPFLANNGGGEYTAEVWAGVPSIGHSTVKQDFRARISGGKITSVTLLGGGYMSGVSWGQYNHIRSWYTTYSSGTKLDIYIKGNINYLFNLVNTNYTATFLEELKVSGSSLVRQW